MFSVKELRVVIEHFDKYPLVTSKLVEFIILKKIVFLIETKEHLSKEGLKKIKSLKAYMNLATRSFLQPTGFPDVLQRAMDIKSKVLDPY